MSRTPLYLYRIKNSKNYYFRIRKNLVFQKLSYLTLDSSHFVASLKTSKFDEAMWLAQFIVKRLKEEMNMENAEQYAFGSHPLNGKRLGALMDKLGVDERMFALKTKSFLKARFTYWLALGKKMLQVGLFEPEQLQSLRTVRPSVLQKHYRLGEMADMHPTPNASRVQDLCEAAQSLGFNVDPRAEDALMLNRLIAELQKLGKEYKNYSPELVNNEPEVALSKDADFINLLLSLKKYTAFARRVERQQKVEDNKHQRLDTCIENFCLSQFKTVGESAQAQYKKSFEVLVSTFGAEKLVSEFSVEDALRFKNVVIKMESGRGNENTLSVKTINKYLSNVSVFFDWIKKELRYVERNPLKGMSLKLKKRHQMQRRQFTPTEIAKLLDYKPINKKEARTFRDAAKWSIPIALYTGMRVSEIAAIRIRDVREADGIWYLDLTERQGKTEGARRYVPVHSKLINMGLLGYVEQLRLQGETDLFPELSANTKSAQRDGRGTPLSKWFNRTVLKNLGIDKSSEIDMRLLIDFHCSRHTVASWFKANGVDGYIAKQILGHDQSLEITWGVYAGRESTKLSKLKEAIETLTY